MTTNKKTPNPTTLPLSLVVKLTKKNCCFQVLLGLGMATLRPTQATEAVVVANVDGARVAGIIVQAGPPVNDKVGALSSLSLSSSSLLQCLLLCFVHAAVISTYVVWCAFGLSCEFVRACVRACECVHVGCCFR